MNRLVFYICAVAILLGGCAPFTPETWVNRGPATMDASRAELIYCYDDASFIDGERMVGTLCATPTSGFFMHGEPAIKFGPWNRKFMSALVSEAENGVEQDYRGKRVNLKCSSVLDADSKEKIGSDCSVSINDQHLVSAKFIFKK